MHHGESERVLAEVEKRLEVRANRVSPCLLEVSIPPPQPIMPVVDGPADRRKRRVELDLRIAARESASMSCALNGFGKGGRDLDALSRHVRSLSAVPLVALSSEHRNASLAHALLLVLRRPAPA